ncbi:MAG: hypothetical protein R8G66_08010 [Cytophagales bacterium]|nr:hypothetical protein [Cytophagales bacterium]
MNRNQTILLVCAILLTAFFGVFAEIRKGYAEDAEQILKEGRQQLELAERTSLEIKSHAQQSAADARIALNDLETVEAALKKCKNGE